MVGGGELTDAAWAVIEFLQERGGSGDASINVKALTEDWFAKTSDSQCSSVGVKENSG